MACNDIAYPYLDHATGNHKHVGTVREGALCTTVIVRSNMVAVPIETIPSEDDMGRGTPGITQFCREYPESAPLTVTLTAPDEWREVAFQRWIINDVEQPEGQTVVSFEVDGECIVAFAKFGTDIIIVNCPQITLPSHMMVSLASWCSIFDNVPNQPGVGTTCLPRTWRAGGLEQTVSNIDGGPVWTGETFIRTCPVNVLGDPLHICASADCTEDAPPPPGSVCLPGCICDTATTNLWATQYEASFAISCSCDPSTNIVSVNYGISFRKEGCRGAMYYRDGSPGCGGGNSGWHCHVLNHVFFYPVYATAPPRTASYDGSQEDCDAKVRQLAQGPFSTTFEMTVTAGQPFPPPLFEEMRCTGIITAN